MKEYLNPKPFKVMERCTFNKARQEQSESVAEFSAKLKNLELVLNCNFNKNLNTALQNQFVYGFKKKQNQNNFV